MRHKLTQSGFTLVELVTVIAILGLLAVAVVPRMLSRSSFETRTAEDQLINAIRHAQQLAMSKPVGANVQLQTDSANDRIRITYNEAGVQTQDIPIAANVDIDVVSIGFSKNGDPSASPTIGIDNGARQVCVTATGYAHGC